MHNTNTPILQHGYRNNGIRSCKLMDTGSVIKSALKNTNGLLFRDIVAMTGKNRSTVKCALVRMRERGEIGFSVTVGVDGYSKAYRYFLTSNTYKPKRSEPEYMPTSHIPLTAAQWGNYRRV